MNIGYTVNIWLDSELFKDVKYSPLSENYVQCFFCLSRSGTTVTLPVNFNIDRHITQYPPYENGFTTRLAKFDKDKASYILGLLTSIPARNKDLIVADGYIPINAEILNGFITDYNSYLIYLTNTGVIEKDSSVDYYEGHSRRYRWTTQYIGSDFGRVEMPKFTLLSDRKKAITVEEFYRQQRQRMVSYPYLAHWYGDNKLRLDIGRAKRYAQLIRDYKNSHPNERDWNKDKEQYKSPYNQYAAIIENLNSINDKDYKVQIDSHVHRLHSVLTNMQKDFRNFFTYDDKALVSIDIKNSQPYLSCALFNPEFWNNNSSLYLRLNQLPQNIRNSINFVPPRPNAVSIPAALTAFFRGLSGSEFDEYKRIVSSGQMYETIMQWVQEEQGISITRDAAKTTMFKLIFSSNRNSSEDENHWLTMYYRERFPQVTQLFSIIKRSYQDLDEEKQYGRLACLLQSIESEIILHRCCKRIWEERDHQVPVFTIHDSIATTTDYKDYVKSVMTDELHRSIGIPPRLSEESWSEAVLQANHSDLYAQLG